jgi:hypothetical protein
MSCFAMDSRTNRPSCSAKVSWTNDPSCTMWLRHVTKYDTKYDVNPHSNEKDKLPRVFLISKQVVPYQTCGGICCLGVSTPKIQSLVNSSITCHDGINHLHHSIHCSNHNIDPHTVKSHLNGWETTTLSQRHKSYSTSQRIKDLYDTQDCMAKQIYRDTNPNPKGIKVGIQFKGCKQ